MNKELTLRLYADFPTLYQGRTKPQTESSMCWGFECGDGWYPLLQELSEQLMAHLEQHPELKFEITQIKSKNHSLRIHYRGADIVIETLIARTCQQALVTSEIPESLS